MPGGIDCDHELSNQYLFVNIYPPGCFFQNQALNSFLKYWEVLRIVECILYAILAILIPLPLKEKSNSFEIGTH
jgi:hypothetical protein